MTISWVQIYVSFWRNLCGIQRHRLLSLDRRKRRERANLWGQWDVFEWANVFGWRTWWLDNENGLNWIHSKSFQMCFNLSGAVHIQPGNNCYDFACNLPLSLPTSLEGVTGHIRYKAKVVLDGPTGPDVEYEEMFTVIKPLNLNLDPDMRVLPYHIDRTLPKP